MVQQDVVVSRVGTIHSLGRGGVINYVTQLGEEWDEYSGDPKTDHGKYMLSLRTLLF